MINKFHEWQGKAAKMISIVSHKNEFSCLTFNMTKIVEHWRQMDDKWKKGRLKVSDKPQIL